MAIVVVNGTDSIDQWRAKTNTISTSLGDPAAITTTAQNVVGGINEIKTDLDNATGGQAIPRPALIAMA